MPVVIAVGTAAVPPSEVAVTERQIATLVARRTAAARSLPYCVRTVFRSNRAVLSLRCRRTSFSVTFDRPCHHTSAA
jgi:hypothetical protein